MPLLLSKRLLRRAESMRSYFLPSRFYSREYPYTRVKAGMVHTRVPAQTCTMITSPALPCKLLNMHPLWPWK